MTNELHSEDEQSVLFVDHAEYEGGSGVSLRTLLNQLEGRVRRLVASPPGPATEVLRRERLADEHLIINPIARDGRASPLRVLRAASQLAVHARRHRDGLLAIHANGVLDAILSVPAALVTRRSVVVWVHDADVGRRRSSALLPWLRRLTPEIRWAPVSQATATELVDRRIALRDSVFVVPNPIEANDLVEARAAEGDVLHVGFLGTDTDRKGFDLLPDVARQLDPERARLLVFARKHTGLPAHISSAWKALEEMPDRVELCGRVADVRTAYARCDVVLCPSRMESFCRVAAEAMANGLPVVGSDIPAIREVLADGNAGLLVPPGDEHAAATAIGRLCADTRLRDALTTAGLERSRDFEPATITARFVELYRAGRSR